jgi:hypothetical protein
MKPTYDMLYQAVMSCLSKRILISKQKKKRKKEKSKKSKHSSKKDKKKKRRKDDGIHTDKMSKPASAGENFGKYGIIREVSVEREMCCA